MFDSLKVITRAFAVAVVASSAMLGSNIANALVVQCGADVCSSGFEILVNGEVAGMGELLYDAASGDISLNTDPDSTDGMVTSSDAIMWMDSASGSRVFVNNLSGNADPILGFALGATTASVATSFSFIFDLPIAIEGPINANSSVSYSLTSETSAGAQVTALGNVVEAWEVDNTPGGLGSLNKGVDVGDTFGFVGGPQTQNSPVYTASNSFTGDLAYDAMTVRVSFSLSADSNVGLSGFVNQVVVPVPAAVWLFASGLLGMVGVARRKKAA